MRVVINGQLIEYRDEGSGRVILLLHGWGANLTTFNQLANHLAKSFRVIRFDFPGFGQSPKPVEDWFVSNYSLVTRDLLQKLRIDKLYATIAHSFGGRVVIKGINLGCFKPEKVVLIGTAGVKPHQTFKKTMYKTVAKIGKFVVSIPVLKKAQPMLRKRLYSVVGSTDYLDVGPMKRIFINVINEDLLAEVSQIAQPTLLIWGENDNQTPLADANLILDRLNDGLLVVIPGAGHFVYVDAYNEVIKELDGFLT